jgi:hypothetical protein
MTEQFTNWLVAILTPILLARSAFAAYFLFGFLALGTVVVLFSTMPETRRRSLEDIQEAFNKPVLKSWVHHLRQLTSRIYGRSSLSSMNSSIELSEILEEGPATTSSVERGLRLEVTNV